MRCIEGWPTVVESYSGDEYVVRVRDNEMRTRLTRSRCPARVIPRVALPRSRTTASCCASCARRTCPAASRSPPACSRSSARARTRRGCSPARATPSAPTAASTCCRRAAGDPAVDRVRLGHALRPRPGERPDVYGKVGNSGVSIATLDDMKALYAGFDLVRAHHVGVDDDQRPGADDPGDVPEYRDRPAGRKFRATTAASPPTTEAAKIRARVLATVRGTVQADILKEDQGQNTCIFSTEFCVADDGRHPGVVHRQRRPQLLLGVDLRLPHRRGGREPDQPARLHAGQRVHVRRGLPRARHEHRRLRAEPVVLLLQRHGPRVHGASAGSRGGSGRSRCATGTARTSGRRSSSTTCRRRAGRCTRRRWRSTTSAPRCRRCARSTTTRTACTPTPTTRRSRRPPRSRCAARWRSR